MTERAVMTLAALMILFGVVDAQVNRISSVVVDSQTAKPLEGVNIVVVGRGLGAVSDSRGRFVLEGSLSGQDTLEITHIGYAARRLTVDSLLVLPRIDLVARPIETEPVEIQAERESLTSRDLPASITVVPLGRVESQAVNLGEVLRRDPSLAISEQANGAEFVSIRGGNSDEVLVVYDGIRLNSSMTNAFDLSQIALTNLDRVEVIKGSNTVLFGEGAFGGVLHIVPNKDFDRNVTVVQRVGTFQANDLSLSLGRRIGNLGVSYTLSRRQAERKSRLANDNVFHTAWMSYKLGTAEFSGRYIRISNGYEDRLFGDQIDTDADIFSSTLENRFGFLGHFGVSVIHRDNRESNGTLPELQTDRVETERFGDAATILRLFKRDVLGAVRLYSSYEKSWQAFDGSYERTLPAPLVSSSTRTELRRRHDSFTAVIQNHLNLDDRGDQTLDWDVSARLDRMSDDRLFLVQALNSVRTTTGAAPSHTYFTYKFGLSWSGHLHTTRFRAYATNGSNVKFPTLEQQYYADNQPLFEDKGLVLQPERNSGTEVGIHLETPLPADPTVRHIAVLRTDLALFRNSYTDKIAEHLAPLDPRFGRSPFNTDAAQTTGLETKVGLSAWEGLVDVSFGYLGLNISDPRAFQFKPDSKTTLTVSIQRSGLSVWGSYFHEGLQRALILSGGQVGSVELPPRWDVDLGVRQALSWHGVRVFAGLSVFNLRNMGYSDPTGYYLRDRRSYLTFGIEL